MKTLLSPVDKVFTFIKEVFVELRAMEWVSRKEAVRLTGFIVFYIALLTTSIFVIDLILVAVRVFILDSNRII